MTPLELLRAMTLIVRQYVADYGSTPPLHEERWLLDEAEVFFASVDTLPKGQDAKQGLAGTESGAVPNEDSADAIPPKPYRPSQDIEQ